MGGHTGGGGLFDHLLMAALQAAIAFEKVDNVAMGVAEDLDLDVAGVGDILLDQAGGVAET